MIFARIPPADMMIAPLMYDCAFICTLHSRRSPQNGKLNFLRQNSENIFIKNLLFVFCAASSFCYQEHAGSFLCRCRTSLLCLPLHLYAVAAPRPFGKTFYRKRSSAFFQNTGFRENKPKKRKFSNNFSIFSKKCLKRNALVL